jgi:hypothetical protein
MNKELDVCIKAKTLEMPKKSINKKKRIKESYRLTLNPQLLFVRSDRLKCTVHTHTPSNKQLLYNHFAEEITQTQTAKEK